MSDRIKKIVSIISDAVSRSQSETSKNQTEFNFSDKSETPPLADLFVVFQLRGELVIRNKAIPMPETIGELWADVSNWVSDEIQKWAIQNKIDINEVAGLAMEANPKMFHIQVKTGLLQPLTPFLYEKIRGATDRMVRQMGFLSQGGAAPEVVKGLRSRVFEVHHQKINGHILKAGNLDIQ